MTVALNAIKMVSVNAATTPSQRLASHLLGEDLTDWVKTYRHPLPDLTRSWDAVASKLDELTGGQVSVNGETLRKWWLAWGQDASDDLDGAA